MSSRQAERVNRLRREKRGVVLLVVVSILTLFLMVGVTYVLIAGHYHDSSKQNQRAKRYGDEGEREMEEVLGQVLFGTAQGTTGPRSVISPHNLLEDLYGTTDGVIGTLASAPVSPAMNAGQTMYFQVNLPTVQSIPNYFGGRVITFTNGPAAGLSTRVMGYFPTGFGGGGTPELMVESPESDLPIPVVPNNGDRFIINGAPFNGTGGGYEVASQNLNASLTLTSGASYLTAYLPNHVFYPPGINPAVGGMDEQYDVPNWDNMFMAFIPPSKLQATVPDRTDDPMTAVNEELTTPPLPILPSFHRPDLVRFWATLMTASPLMANVNANQRYRAFIYPFGPDAIWGTADDIAGLTLVQAQEIVALKRMIVLRPLREDHPYFTGGNSNFVEDKMAYYNFDSDNADNDNNNATGVDRDTDGDGIYDVDNDGDGIPESIWVDPGLPVVTAPNGRRYKRLVAICIKDQDGRVNPNVHGNQIVGTTASARTGTPVTGTVAGTDPTTPAQIYLPRGMGFGPAEVDFRHIFNNVLPYASTNDDTTVYNNILDQRYASSSYPATLPGFPNNDDGWSQVRTIGMPTFNQGDHTNAPLSAYSTPPDVWGRGALAVDYTGQPLWAYLGIGERIDDPYEVQWDQLRASADAPYTVSELEALLRYHDQGAAIIPSRLLTLAGTYLASESRGTPGASQIVRESFGMGSYIPAPRLSVPRELRASFNGGAAVGNSSILDLYYYRLSQNTTDFQTIVPFEFFKGQLFNLNRELGNGRQDQTTVDPAVSNASSAPLGTVDDPSEQFLPEQIYNAGGTYNFDYLNDADPMNTPDQRHLYARHLYCLAMFLRNENNADIDLDGDPATPPTPQETARYYAQWAINVVDFRDPDSIMSPFEYDNNPNNGWSVDGVVGSGDDMGGERGLVWGCERPELLITENTAGHDRRTCDTIRDPEMRRVSDPVPANRDQDYDQDLRPEGWAFIELYNPWFDRSNNLYDHKPAELYGNGGVELNRLTPLTPANDPRFPVWRILVVRGDSINVNPENSRAEELTLGINGNPPPQTNGRPDVERSIYFADLTAAGVSRPTALNYTDGEAYFPSSTIPRSPVLPGRYAVIGSSSRYDAMAGTYTTYIGRRTDAPSSDTIPDFYDPTQLNLGTTRRIILNPAAVAPTPALVVADNQTNGAADPPAAADIMPVVVLPIDMAMRSGAATPQSFNVTEPTEIEGLYPALVAFPPSPTDEGHYSPAIDEPLDYTRSAVAGGGEWQFLNSDQTVSNHRSIHLQRLANPLMPWDSVTNPYLTIDSSNMDATAYNGVTVDDDDPRKVAGTNLNLQTFQRGGRFSPTTDGVPGYADGAGRVFRDLWRREARAPLGEPSASSPPEGATGPHHLPQNLWHTLGYLNRRYHPFFLAAGGAYRGAPYFQNPVGGPPAAPFPYLAFNNRPFNNKMELLQVPSWGSSKLLERYDSQFLDPMLPPPQPWTSMYQPPVTMPANESIPYGHLPNFFHTSDDPLDTASTYSSEFGRVLDFVETRTPYIDTEKYYSPANFVMGNAAPAGYRPPFNYMSRFREPGRININTIFHSNVWNAAVQGFPGMCTFPSSTYEGDDGLFLTHLVLSRQGYGASPADVLQHNPLYPSLFSHPFRTADSSDMMPPNPNSASIPPETLPRKSPADGGLLRRDLNPYPSIDDPDRPLFGSDVTDPYRDSARNTYFRYQGLQKVGNLFSTNSNCYAVWITMGYFEVEGNDADNNPATPFAIDAAHPDGLRLAQEVGVDTGEVKRHRAFYIIDRSIPVGYEPGHRHNTDKAILLKRFIE